MSDVFAPSFIRKIDIAVSNMNPDCRIVYFQSSSRHIIDEAVNRSVALRARLGVETPQGIQKLNTKTDGCFEGMCSRGVGFNLFHYYRVSGAVGTLKMPYTYSNDESAQTKKTRFPLFWWYLRDFQILHEEYERVMVLNAFLESLNESAQSSFSHPPMLLISSPQNLVPATMTGELELIQEDPFTDDDLYMVFKRHVELQLENEYKLRCQTRDSLTREQLQSEVLKIYSEEELRCVSHGFSGLTADQIVTVLHLLRDDLSDKQSVMCELPRLVKKEKQKEFCKTPEINIVELRSDERTVGLGNFAKWLRECAEDFRNPAAGEVDGIHSPKGVLICGVPGTGKTQLAKEAARALNVELIRFDVSRINSRYFGESEAKLTHFLSRIEANSPCVMLIDEIEKTFRRSGTDTPNHDVKIQMLGILLDWLQERRGNVLTFITANDVSQLPPELLRDGRLTARFFTFMPTHDDLMRILWSKLKRLTSAETELISNDFKRLINVRAEELESTQTAVKQPMNSYNHGPVMDHGNADIHMDNVLNYAVWDIEKSDFIPKTLFLTGANVESLVEMTNRSIRVSLRKRASRRGGATEAEYAAAMVTCAQSDSFSPQGMTNMNDIVNMWLMFSEKHYQDASSLSLVPFDALRNGKIDPSLCPAAVSPYDFYLQRTMMQNINAELGKRLIVRKRR